jgi:hypothetical protein
MFYIQQLYLLLIEFMNSQYNNNATYMALL